MGYSGSRVNLTCASQNVAEGMLVVSSLAASLKTSWETASRLAAVWYVLQVSVNRRDCKKQPCLCCSLSEWLSCCNLDLVADCSI